MDAIFDNQDQLVSLVTDNFILPTRQSNNS